MSGGSFNYLCYKMGDIEILNSDEELNRMIEYLSHCDGEELRFARLRLEQYKRRRELVLAMAQELLFEDETTHEIARLVEWQLSGDYGDISASIRKLLNIVESQPNITPPDDIPF